ncbi:MAG: hypothetical protein IKH30_03975 [Clostridia bacterium]|nr:hypothetical protein [Clostridia bacterium]
MVYYIHTGTFVLFRGVMIVRGDCVYMQVMVQMYMKGWDSRTLAEKSGMTYTSMRRKMRGLTPLYLEEARRIQKALDCGMSLDMLFARRDDAA